MSASGFFRPGGTLPPGSASYVARQADREIIDALLAGEFVFLLDSRQKGKSSLIVRSLERLHGEGVTTFRIDLQRFGANLQPEQWYAGLLLSIGQDLDLTAPLFEYWKQWAALGPATRWFGALEAVVMPAIDGRLVIFVDEVDFVKALPFSADEFFAAIRECYNRRAEVPAFQNLVFCLSGVATPSQLIHNEDVTPFNVGRRIELADLSRQETNPYAEQLSQGGRNGGRLLDRIHHWVNGHPYLTQLLASKIAANPAIQSLGDVDRLVRQALLSAESRQREPNLSDVERRLLEAQLPGASKEESRSRVLEAMRLLLRGELFASIEEEPLVATILLSGVAVESAGRLRIRNRLYATLFNERWRRGNLPDAEARRQKAASRRAAIRVGSISFALFAILGGLFAWLYALTIQRDRANAISRRLDSENRKIAYQASIALAGERIEDGNYLKAIQLVETQRNSTLRGWEWFFLSGLYGSAEAIVRRSPSNERFYNAWREKESLIEVCSDEIFVNGKPLSWALSKTFITTISDWLEQTKGQGPLTHRIGELRTLLPDMGDGYVRLSDDLKSMVSWEPSKPWFDIVDRATRHKVRVPMKELVNGCAISHNGRYVVVMTPIGHASLYDRQTRTWRWRVQRDQFTSARFSPTDDRVLITGFQPEMLVMRNSDGAIATRFAGHAAPPQGAQWQSDGKAIVSASTDGTVRLWDAATGSELRRFLGARTGLVGVTIGEGKILAHDSDGTLLQWDLGRISSVQTLRLNSDNVFNVAVSPDGARCITTSHDSTARLIEVSTGRPVGSYKLTNPDRGHPSAFSRDGKIMSISAVGNWLTIVSCQDGKVLRNIDFGTGHPLFQAFTPDGHIFVPFRDGRIATMDNWQAEPKIWPSAGYPCIRVSCAPDGSGIAVGSQQGDIAVIDPITTKVIRYLKKIHGMIGDVEFSPDGKWISASGYDGNAYLFPYPKPGQVRVLSGHRGRIWQTRFSPDSKRVLTTSYDATARIWDVETGKEQTMLQHSSWVSDAEWSPDSKRVVTACSDKFLRVFDASDGFELLKLSDHEGSVLDVKFSRDGKTVMTVSGDGSTRFWRALPPVMR